MDRWVHLVLKLFAWYSWFTNCTWFNRCVTLFVVYLVQPASGVCCTKRTVPDEPCEVSRIPISEASLSRAGGVLPSYGWYGWSLEHTPSCGCGFLSFSVAVAVFLAVVPQTATISPGFFLRFVYEKYYKWAGCVNLMRLIYYTNWNLSGVLKCFS